MSDTVTPQDTAETALATLVQLSRRARQTLTPAELRFLLVNETHALIAYRQAAFWDAERGVEALSGVTVIEKHASYVQWLKHWFEQGQTGTSFSADLRALPGAGEEADWTDWLPPFVATLSLPTMKAFPGGRLLLARNTPFSSAELELLEEWLEVWVDRYRQVQPKSWRQYFPIKKRNSAGWRWASRAMIVAGLIIVAMLPVRLTVLAPAELIPLEPAIIRAPLDGIVDRVLVNPNQRVTEGEPLFEFDRISVASRLEVTQRALATIQAEYRQRAQRALFDAESKAELVVLQSQIEEKRAEVTYLQELNLRSEVRAPRSGLVFFSDASEWIGRPVVTGERVMVVADEKRSQIEAWIAPEDIVDFPDQAEVTLYLASDPVNSLQGQLKYIVHEPELRPEGHYAYRLRAQLLPSDDATTPRVGLKGTARITGEDVSLIYWVMRRPWAALRGWLGL